MLARRWAVVALGLGWLGCAPPAPGDRSPAAGDDDDDDQDHDPGAGDDDGDEDVDCLDRDDDGYGVGDGCRGEDCDDADPDVRACDCGVDGLAHQQGCTCDTGQPDVCYSGADGTAGSGECRSGLRRCVDGRWSGCEGEVVGREEQCDGLDNDCDGEVDEGVLSACGDCSVDCEELAYGADGLAFDPGPANSSGGLVATDDGGLTLSQEEVSASVIWIANSLEGTVSKFDTRTREELARYRTGPLGTSLGYWSGDGENPSRTSVNYFGDAYVANRSFTAVASVTKVLYDDCPDHGDGTVDTSTRGDDVLAWDADGPRDDCIAWNTPVGGLGGVGRAVASQLRQEQDGAMHEYVWMGIHFESRYYELDGETGELTGVEVDLPGCTPYGAAIDGEGNLWSSSLSSGIGRFDTADPADAEVITLPDGRASYGITVDGDGRVWVSTLTPDGIAMYDPAGAEWTTYDTGHPVRGIAADHDGIVWSFGDDGWLTRVDPVLGSFTTTSTGRGGRGVGVDFDGYIWLINWRTAETDGDVIVVDPAMPEDVGTVCCDSIVDSYTYSDMTGFQLQNATAPVGEYELALEGCDEDEATEWAELDLGADVPEGAGVRIEIRTADTLADLSSADWILLGDVPPDEPPFAPMEALDDAGVLPGRYLGVRLTLQSFDGDALPVVRVLEVRRSCEGTFG